MRAHGLTRRGTTGILLAAAGAALTTSATGSPSHHSFAPRNWSDLSETMRVSEGLSVRFMGTSTILIEDGSTALLIDGFFSRPSLARFLTTGLTPDETQIAEALRRAQIGRLALVLTAHSHHDHAMDSALVARRGEALLAGSHSVEQIAEGAAFPMERFRLMEHRTVLEIERPWRFRITAFETPHSRPELFPGPITSPFPVPIWGPLYRGGENFAFLIEHSQSNMLVVPGANFVCDGLRTRQADVVFLSVGSLGRQPQAFFDAYWRETVQLTGARVVVLTHWDDFFVHLDQPLRPMRKLLDDVATALARVEQAAARDGVKVVIPPAFRPASVAQLLADTSEPTPPNLLGDLCSRAA